MNTVVPLQLHSTESAGEQGHSIWGRTFTQCARAAVALCIVTGIAYPLATTVVAQWAFADRAAGSLVERDGRVVGSSLVGQAFTGAQYFQGRPSVTSAPDPKNPDATVNTPYNAAMSAGSNQGATSQSLDAVVAERVAAYRQSNGLAANVRIPVDAVTASASGLDPHISVANAKLQIARVARARGLSPALVQSKVQESTRNRDLLLLGEPRVNVLELNLALDAIDTTSAKE